MRGDADREFYRPHDIYGIHANPKIHLLSTMDFGARIRDGLVPARPWGVVRDISGVETMGVDAGSQLASKKDGKKGAKTHMTPRERLMWWRAAREGSSTLEGRKRREGERRGRKKKLVM